MTLDNELFLTIRDVLACSEIITVFFGTIYFWKYNNGFIKYFLFFLWYILVNESIQIFIQKFEFYENSFFVSNIFKLIQFTFYLTLYYKTINKHIFKKINLGLIVVFLTSYIYSAICDNFLENSLTTSNIIGSVFVTISVSTYFIELLNSDLILKTTKLLMFWISSALLIYFVPLIPFLLAEKYYYDSEFIPYIYLSKYILVFLMNILFIIGFICSQKIQKV